MRLVKYTILLIFLAGCANSQHKHPHDHGLAPVLGNVKRLDVTNEILQKRMQGLQFQLEDTRKGQDELETILFTHIELLVKGQARLGNILERERVKLRMLGTGHEILFTRIDKMTGRIEKLEKKIKPQKLIELMPENR